MQSSKSVQRSEIRLLRCTDPLYTHVKMLSLTLRTNLFSRMKQLRILLHRACVECDILYAVNLCRARRLPFALKIVNKTKCQGRERMIENEVSILRKIKHPNIVQLIDEFHSSDTLYLVMELVTASDRHLAIRSRRFCCCCCCCITASHSLQ